MGTVRKREGVIPISRPSAGLYKMLVKWVAISSIIGLLTGLLVAFLEFSVLDISELALRRIAEARCIWLIPIVPFVGISLTGVIRDRVMKLPQLHGTEEVLDSYHYKDGEIVLRDAFTKTIGAVLTVGSGGSAGLEGPSIHIGGAVGAAIRRLLSKLGVKEDGRILLLTGAASGMSAIFKAPLTGLMFALEVPYKDDMAHQAVIPALISSVVSYLTLVSILGTKPIFRAFEPFGEVTPYILGIGLLEGILMGLSSMVFVKLISAVEGLLDDKSYTFRGLIGGISVGLLAIGTLFTFGTLYPFGLSYDLVKLSFKGEEVTFFLSMAILKMVATALTLGSAGIGGVFIPSIVIGASLGSAMSYVDPSMTSLFVALGMSSFLAGAFKTPLAAVAFVAETTGSEAYVIPCLIASAVAYIISGKYSLPKNQKVVETATIEELERVEVKEIMAPPPPVLRDDLTIKEFFNRYFLKYRDRFVFPIETKDGRVVGVVVLGDVNDVPTSEWDRIKLIDVARKVNFARPDDSLMTALDKMYESGVSCLPVMDPKKGSIVGTLSADAIIMLVEQKRKLKKAFLFIR